MDTIESTKKVTNGFSKLPCSVCKRETWHYMDRGAQNPVPHCTVHIVHSVKSVVGESAADRQAREIEEERKWNELTAQEEARIQALERKWKEGREGTTRIRKHKFTHDQSLSMFGERPVKPNGPVCSFCHKETSLITATQGKGPLRITTVQEVVNDEIVENTVVRQRKVLACPDCVGNLKPQLDKEGNITRQAFDAASEV